MEPQRLALPSSASPLALLSSAAAASSPLATHRSEAATAFTEEQPFSPACPLHGVFLSEADIQKEGRAAVPGRSTRQPSDSSSSSLGFELTPRDIGQRSTSGVPIKHNGETNSNAGRRNKEHFAHEIITDASRDGATKATAEYSSWSKEGTGVHSSACDNQWSTEARKARFLVIFRNCVYNLAGFHHPGGEELLENRYGTDITEAFEEAGHSVAAYKMLGDYIVGIVAERREAYISQVGGPTCLCHGIVTDANKTCLASEASQDTAAAEYLKAPGISVQQEATRLRLTAKDLHALQAAPPTLIPTGSDGYPLHPFLDFHRPLLPQIWNLSREDYFRLVNSHSLTTKVVPLMRYAWMEPFSKTHWWVIPLVWLPWTIYLLDLSCRRHCAAAVLVMFLVGLGMWSIVEYVLHRFIFHFPEVWLPDFSCVRVAHFVLHAVHHVLPLDPLRLVVPPLLLVFLSLWVYAAISLVFPQWFILGAWPGGMLGYMAYDMVHYSTHHSSVFCRFAHVRKMKVYHMQHHFKHPMLGFGVSSKFWDHLFGTTLPSTA